VAEKRGREVSTLLPGEKESARSKGKDCRLSFTCALGKRKKSSVCCGIRERGGGGGERGLLLFVLQGTEEKGGHVIVVITRKGGGRERRVGFMSISLRLMREKKKKGVGA